MVVVENKLKIGQQFEVVEVLTDGGYLYSFKCGGWSVGYRNDKPMLKVLPNSIDSVMEGYHLSMAVGKEVKPVGRLTVKEVKS